MAKPIKGPGGQATKQTEELIAIAANYIDGGWKDCGDKVPTIAGLACETGVTRETLYAWERDKVGPISDILTRARQIQERELVNGGLGGEFNPAVTKMMMSKHGYSDRVEQDHTSSDGSMTPKPTEVRLVAQPLQDDSSGG